MNPKKFIREVRWELCKGCEELHPLFNTCNQCGCFMKIKTQFMWAKCPLEKWDKMSAQDIEEISNIIATDSSLEA